MAARSVETLASALAPLTRSSVRLRGGRRRSTQCGYPKGRNGEWDEQGDDGGSALPRPEHGGVCGCEKGDGCRDRRRSDEREQCDLARVHRRVPSFRPRPVPYGKWARPALRPIPTSAGCPRGLNDFLIRAAGVDCGRLQSAMWNAAITFVGLTRTTSSPATP